ncbi:DUF190 domain-containing protein [Bordetella sp. FB-8]|uniref:DUF190 domain-containing protein n=1 Tax=Bordetella sp. FB-8 TaxID=1159870 RepID=UPI00037DC427|nr:DUF190 domain-containing protein [Bordetella sp. FB-8]
MTGYMLTFFTQQDRLHHGTPLADWLVKLAAELDLGGATLVPAGEGMGHDHHLHSTRFFELTDQPVSVVMVVTAPECDRLFERLQAEGVQVFYVKSTVEFGKLGGA